MNKTTTLIYTALFIALGLLVPQFFHFFGGTGPIFLPMHIPVLLSGFFLGKRAGLLVGLVTPMLSSMLTGMPAVPILYFMVAELMAYGFMAGYLYKERDLSVIPALLFSMIMGRIILALAVFTLQPLLGLTLSPLGYLTGAITSGLPGMLLQLFFIPTIVKLLEKAGVFHGPSKAPATERS